MNNLKNNILSTEYVMENGVDFEDLWNEYCSDRILDKPDDEGGKPFTGLAYELYDDEILAYYCFYKDGFMNGEYVTFYKNNHIKSKSYMEYGRVTGKEEVWFENGNLKSVATYELSICLNLQEWDFQGSLIKEKLAPTEEEIKNLIREREWNKRLGRV